MAFDNYNFLHTKRRMKERIGVAITEKDYQRFCHACRNGYQFINWSMKTTRPRLGSFLERQTKRTMIRKNLSDVEFHTLFMPEINTKFIAVYNKRKETIVTIYPFAKNKSDLGRKLRKLQDNL